MAERAEREQNTAHDRELPQMFRPPLAQGMKVLDRAFFRKDVTVAAARIFDAKKTSILRTELMKAQDLLNVRAVRPMALDPEDREGRRKCFLLRESINAADRSTWSPTTARLADTGDISLFPFTLTLNYDHFSAHSILESILPPDLHDDIPTGFSAIGHIAHFNLNPPYLPYKELIGAVTIDKNPAITTVINKISTLDDNDENEFRVLNHEVIAGPPDLVAEMHESGCVYRVDLANVFWNSRLNTEHQRIISKLSPGEAVCDVMAGIGPFVIPAAKKGVFAWGNDLNPHCEQGMHDAVRLNRVADFVTVSCEDGHTFIPNAVRRLLDTTHVARVQRRKPTRTELLSGTLRDEDIYSYIPQPRIFSHFLMNLPATAPDFLSSYFGIYHGHEELFHPHTAQQLPMVHCYCFAAPGDPADGEDYVPGEVAVCRVLTERLGVEFKPDMPDLEIFDVRSVAPNKDQYCASFRLPPEVAFAEAKKQ